MRVMPTLEGGLKIDVETATDWLVLEQIAPDALEGGAEKLPSRLGALMDEESDWDEMVIPELQEFFSGQLRKVIETVVIAQRNADKNREINQDKAKHQAEPKDQKADKKKKSEGDVPEGEVFIGRGEGAEWYGALNQARLALERRYKFGPSHGVTEVESFSAAKRSAFIRSQFYCALQSVLLEHVLD